MNFEFIPYEPTANRGRGRGRGSRGGRGGRSGRGGGGRGCTTNAVDSSELQMQFYQPRDTSGLASVPVTNYNITEPITVYQYLDLDEDGGYNVRVAGPPNEVELAVVTVYRMEQLDQDADINDAPLDDNEETATVDDPFPVDGIDFPEYVWTSTYKRKRVWELITLVVNRQFPVCSAAALSGIKLKTAYRYHQEYREDISVLPEFTLASEVHKPCHNQKINQAHSEFIEETVRVQPTVTIKDIRHKLLEHFPGL